MMSRYDRLLSLSTFSKEKLNKLQSKNVLIIGVGGVGQHVSTYLITNGIKKMTIVDFDKVELSNLNRQILLTEEDIGRYKVEVVKEVLLKKNSEAQITSINQKIDAQNIEKLIHGYDVIVDAVDNWETKLIIAKAEKDKNIPLLHVGVDGNKGQFALFKNKSLLDIVDSKVKASPHDGVMGPMVGLLSSFGSLLLLHFLAEEEIEIDTLFYFDEQSNHLGKMKI